MSTVVTLFMASTRKRGIRKTLWVAGVRLLQGTRRRYEYLSALVFDVRHGIRTRGIVWTVPDAPSGARYEATPRAIFRDIMRSLPVDPTRFTFVDVGCGKGLALLLASKLEFKRLIGVEASRDLATIAQRNVTESRASNWRNIPEIVHEDATRFTFPDEPLVVYMYLDPTASSLKAIISNLDRSLTSSPREAILVYHAPVHRHLFSEASSLALVDDLSRIPPAGSSAESRHYWAVYAASGVQAPA